MKPILRGLKTPPGINSFGVYACRVEPLDRNAAGLLDDLFLMWHEGKWWYPRSAERCTREVLAWVGPIPRSVTPVGDEDEL